MTPNKIIFTLGQLQVLIRECRSMFHMMILIDCYYRLARLLVLCPESCDVQSNVTVIPFFFFFFIRLLMQIETSEGQPLAREGAVEKKKQTKKFNLHSREPRSSLFARPPALLHILSRCSSDVCVRVSVVGQRYGPILLAEGCGFILNRACSR